MLNGDPQKKENRASGGPESALETAANKTPFALGVNYWPRCKAMYWWSDFEIDEVRQEFALIADLGLTIVRIFLLWDDWQPRADEVNQKALRDLESVADIAAERGLSLDVTFFTGHMSGPNWAPRWLLQRDKDLPSRVNQLVSGGEIVDCGYANPYHDPRALQATDLLLTAVVSRLRQHPGIGFWNLGNEPDLFALPHSAADGRAWARHCTQLIKSIDAHHPVTCGLHVQSLFADNGLRVPDIFGEVDFPVMHGYPMYIDWAHGPLDSDFVPFLCALTSALCGKPALMEEFGGCTVAPGQLSQTWEWTAYGEPRSQFMASEEAFAEYIGLVLPKLVQVGATGALLWCFADYIPTLYDRPPCLESHHERFFGLVRPDGSLKPHAKVFRDFAATRPLVQPAERTIELGMSTGDYYLDPASHARLLYAQFLASTSFKE